MDLEATARAWVDEQEAREQRWRKEDRIASFPPFGNDASPVSLRKEVARAGLDADVLDRLAARQTKQRRRHAEKARLADLARSPEIARRLADRTPALTPADPEDYILLDEVTFLRTFVDAGTLVDSAIAPLNTWARYRFAADGISSDTPSGRLAFFTLWRNEGNRTAVVSPGVRLVVHARLTVETDGSGIGGWFGIVETVEAEVRVRITAHALWDQRLSSVVAERELARINSRGGFFGGDDYHTIEFNEHLSGSAFSVSRNQTVMIEVELLTLVRGNGGEAKLDAESGAYRVSLPHLLLVRG